jgi:hypothetical protein
MPPLQPGKVVSSSGKVVNAPASTKKASPTSTGSPTLDNIAVAKQASAQANAAALAATRAEDKAMVQGAKVAAGKVVVAPPVNNPLPVNPPSSTPSPSVIPEPTPQPAPAAIDKSSGLVDGVNFKQQYFDAIKELTLSLINSAKGLLGKYNFSTIDRVPEYYLDLDREATSTAVISAPSRLSPPFGPVEADYQDKFSLDVNEINNKISDILDDVSRSAYFGTLRGDSFTQGEMKIMNGNSYYDMRLVFNSISSQQNFVVKCYEI